MPVDAAENAGRRKGAVGARGRRALPLSRPLERLLVDEFDRVGLAFMVGRRDEQQRLPHRDAVREVLKVRRRRERPLRTKNP